MQLKDRDHHIATDHIVAFYVEREAGETRVVYNRAGDHDPNGRMYLLREKLTDLED